MRKGLPVVLLALSSCAAFAQEAAPSYESFRHWEHETRFEYSEARATQDDPVRISAVGRAKNVEDRGSRTALQRHWLAVNVPDAWDFQDRYQAECREGATDGVPSCDVYVFVDPKTNAPHDYWFYLGDWPHAEDAQ